MYPFDVERPKTIAQAVEAMSQEDAQALAGGQTLIPTLKQRLAMPSVLVSLSGVDEMKGVCFNDAGQMCIGAATTHADVAKSTAQTFAGLSDLAGQIGDPAVRNRGTIGGSLANNDPAACYPAVALATSATLVTDRREIAAADYFQGMFATALEEAELLTEVRLPIPERSAYAKFAQPASRFALVGVFVAKYADHVGVAVTGASEEGVFRWSEAEQALADQFDADAIAGLAPPEEDMISDLHGSADYRAHLVKVMTGREVTAAQ